MGNLLSFAAGYLARDILQYFRENQAENQNNQRAALALVPRDQRENAQNGRIQGNLNPEILAIEANQVQNENHPENDLYEQNRAQWWDRFAQPIHRGTRSHYRNNARNNAEERLYQVM